MPTRDLAGHDPWRPSPDLMLEQLTMIYENGTYFPIIAPSSLLAGVLLGAPRRGHTEHA